MRIGLAGPYNAYTGYGNDLLGLAKALDAAGVDVVPVATSIMTGLPPEVAKLFCKDPAGKFDVLLRHVPPFDQAVPDYTRSKADLIVGWSMWEQSELNRADMRGHRQGRRPWKNLDMLLAYDQVSMGAFEHYDSRVPMKLLQGGIWADKWEYVERDWFGTFKFCMLGELHMRKDPFVAIDAYRELRDAGELKDSEFHLKTSVPGLHPAIGELIPGVHIHCGMWSPQRVREFVESSHVLLSPSKGEGKNLPALEIQLSGGVAVCTGWGGPQMWQHRSYSPVLDYELVPIGPGSTSMQAAASKEHLKEIMLDLYENRAKAKEMGRIASGVIRKMCDWPKVVETLLLHLKGASRVG